MDCLCFMLLLLSWHCLSVCLFYGTKSANTVCGMQKLKDDGKVWCIFNAEQKQDVLFPCDPKPLVTISQDLVNFWHNIKVVHHIFCRLIKSLHVTCHIESMAVMGSMQSFE